MNSLVDILVRLHRTMRDDHHVDLDMESLIAAARDIGTRDKLKETRRAIRARLVMVDEARARLASALPHVEQLLRIWPFTADGWPEARGELAGRLRSDGLRGGVSAWLAHAWTALAEGRADSLDRLLADVPLPDGGEALVDQTRAAALGLRVRDHSLVERFLAYGRTGVEIDGKVVPRSETRNALTVLEVRLAAADGEWTVARSLLDELEGSGTTPTTAVLRAMLARLENQGGESSDADAGMWESPDARLEAAAEAAARARDRNGIEERIQGARVAVEALPSLVDVQSELDRLVVPVPELWLAVAERALREDDEQTAALALNCASQQVDAGDDVLNAQVLQTAGALSRDAEEQGRAFVDAGVRWVAADELNRARIAYERGLAALVTSGSVSVVEIAKAELRLADCVITLAAQKAPSSAEHEVRDGLTRLCEARHKFSGDVGDDSWCFLSEARGRLFLARLMIENRLEEKWLALEAVLRAVAYNLDSGYRWSELAHTAESLEIDKVALWASAIAEDLDDSPGTVETRISILTNAGRFQDALDRLAGVPVDEWATAITAHCLLRTGNPRQALEAYSAAMLGANMVWAWHGRLVAAILARDQALVRSLAVELKQFFESRVKELDVMLALSLAKFVLGETEDLEAWLQDVLRFGEGADREDAFMIRAIWRITNGDSAAGLSDLKESVVAHSRAGAPVEWRMVKRPLVEALVDIHGVQRPDFTDIETLIDAWTPLSAVDPVSDARAASQPSDDLAQRTLALLAAVLEATTDEPDLVVLAALPESLVAERERLEAQVRAKHRPDHVPEPFGSDSATAPDDPLRVGPEIRLRLPASWFAGYDDPVSDHLLFLRALPEARAVAAWDVPFARVSAWEDLEPNRYRLYVDDTLVASGSIPLPARFIPASAISLCPDSIADGAFRYQPDWLEVPLMAIPEPAAEESASLPDLLSFDRWDLAARIITSDLSRQAVEQGVAAG